MDTDEQIELTPRDLIRRFHACSNYPRQDEAACMFLAQDLAKAARMCHVTPTAIVERCSEQSTFCPTGADLLTVAREVRDEGQRANAPNPIAKWEKELRAEGTKPAPFDLNGYDHEKAKRCQAERGELFSAAKKLGLFVNGNWPSDAAMVIALRADGYPKTAHQAEVMKAWERA